MKVIEGCPYFGLNKEKIKSYPYLNGDISCDILIVGGGVDGAVANYFLSQNYDVVLVDKARLGMGCSARATCLLEYQLDGFASELKSYLSEAQIVDIYRAGLNGISKLEGLEKSLGESIGFARRPSFLFSNSIFDKKKIFDESKFRKQNGLHCEVFTRQDNPFNFQAKFGLFAENGGAEVDPYLLCKALIEKSKNQDAIFEYTKVESLSKTSKGFVCQTTYGYKIYCKEVILATGFDFLLARQTDTCKRFVSYSIVTNPLKSLRWQKDALVQDCLSPYHYMRFLPDDRIVFGGKDTPLKGDIDNSLARKKYDKLLKDLKKLFPQEKDIRAEFEFCGGFGTTKNNMGLVGKDKNGLIYFFSCGANGIVNSMIGIEIIEEILNGKTHPLEKIFSPMRE